MSLRIKGLDELKRKIEKVGAEGAPTVEAELLATGLLIERRTKLLAPVRKPENQTKGMKQGGALRASYNTLKIGKSVFVGTGIHYAPHVEYGTYKMKAIPHLLPSYEAELARMIPRLSSKLDKLL